MVEISKKSRNFTSLIQSNASIDLLISAFQIQYILTIVGNQQKNFASLFQGNSSAEPTHLKHRPDMFQVRCTSEVRLDMTDALHENLGR
jgi:hypothetical protein